MSAPVILLVDDELSIQRATATLLRSRGYAVAVAGTGSEALDVFDRERPSLVIVDLGLPDMDGTVVCQRLRARAAVPILVLSVRSEERQKVAALDAGADDYVTKPFSPEELLARVRASLRRSPGGDGELRGRIEHGGLVIDFDRHRVFRNDTEIRLTPKEFELLTVLAAHAGRVLTHRMILKTIWGLNGAGQQEHLRVLVGQLRKKLEIDPAHPRYVLTEPWVGYRFVAEGQ
jgi:two-component system, OmpR family, KDP operon response regulator KdpE